MVQMDLTASGFTVSGVPSGLVVAFIVMLALAGGGLVALLALYGRIMNGLEQRWKALLEAALELRFARHELSESEWRHKESEARERLGYDVRREVDKLEAKLNEVRAEVKDVKGSVDRLKSAQ